MFKEKIKRSKTLIFYIKNTQHNTFFSIFKNNIILLNNNFKFSSNLLKVFSCGSFGFKNKKKETPYAISTLANKSALYALINGYKYIHIIFKGSNILKKIILNTLIFTKYNNMSLDILSVTDTTNFPHNGCRLKKIKKR